jgi:hypothetical protein
MNKPPVRNIKDGILLSYGGLLNLNPSHHRPDYLHSHFPLTSHYSHFQFHLHNFYAFLNCPK